MKKTDINEAPYTLATCLQMFNRKERYWLLRNALGHGENMHLPLSEDFWHQIKCEAHFTAENAQDIWWAMDYHMDWIAGAFLLFGNQGTDFVKPELLTNGLICGTQLDVDLILCYKNRILAIEAKFDASPDADQAKNKKKQVEKLNKFAVTKNLPKECIKLVSISARGKEASSCYRLKYHNDPLALPQKFIKNSQGVFCKTTRCNKIDGTYTHWKVVGAFAPPKDSKA